MQGRHLYLSSLIYRFMIRFKWVNLNSQYPLHLLNHKRKLIKRVGKKEERNDGIYYLLEILYSNKFPLKILRLLMVKVTPKEVDTFSTLPS